MMISSSIPTLLLFLAVCITQSASQQGEWGGCYNKARPNKVKVGEPSRVCLQVANGVNWAEGVNYVRAAFEPLADEYSYYHIPNSYTDLVATMGGTLFARRNITIGAASQTALSFLKMYYDVDKERIYPYLTAIMDVHKGDIRGITWDDACMFCGGHDQCDENTYNFTGHVQSQASAGQKTSACFVSKSDCDSYLSDDPKSTLCDIKLYTVWSGTDVDGKALQSQAFRFSEFPVQKLTDRLTQLVPGFLGSFLGGGDTSDGGNSTSTGR